MRCITHKEVNQANTKSLEVNQANTRSLCEMSEIQNISIAYTFRLHHSTYILFLFIGEHKRELEKPWNKDICGILLWESHNHTSCHHPVKHHKLLSWWAEWLITFLLTTVVMQPAVQVVERPFKFQ